MKRVAIWVLALWLCLSACTSAPVTDTPSPTPDDSLPANTVLLLDGRPIELAELEYQLYNVIEQYIMYTSYDVDWEGVIGTEPAEAYFRRIALEGLLLPHVIEQKAAELGFSLTEAETQEVRGMLGSEISYMGDAAYADYLESIHSNETLHWQHNYLYPYLNEKMMQSLFLEGGPYAYTDADIDAFYAREFCTVSYIYLSTRDDFGHALSDAAYNTQLKIAEALRLRALGGEDFAEMILIYGQDYMMTVSPEGLPLYVRHNGPAFAEAALALAPGEISEVVEGNGGLFIICRREDSAEWLADNRESVDFDYRQHVYNELVQQWLAEIPVVTTPLYDSLDIKSYAPKG